MQPRFRVDLQGIGDSEQKESNIVAEICQKRGLHHCLPQQIRIHFLAQSFWTPAEVFDGHDLLAGANLEDVGTAGSGILGLSGMRGNPQKWRLTDTGDGTFYLSSHSTNMLECRSGVIGIRNVRDGWQKWSIVTSDGHRPCLGASLTACRSVSAPRSVFSRLYSWSCTGVQSLLLFSIQQQSLGI